MTYVLTELRRISTPIEVGATRPSIIDIGYFGEGCCINLRSENLDHCRCRFYRIQVEKRSY